MVQKISIFILTLILINCGIGPKYYDNYQNIELKNITPESKVYLNKISQQIKIENNRINISRSSSNQKLIIDNNENLSEIILQSKITKDKWAVQYGYEIFPHINNGQYYYSASYLLLPTNTYNGIRIVPDFFKEFGQQLSNGNIIYSVGCLGGAILAIPGGLIVDIYNIIIGLPSTAIINPWYSYTVVEKK